MNYNFISQLLDNGIDEKELIASLSKAMPRLAKEAKKMMIGGWSPRDILNSFSKDKKVQNIAKTGLKPVTPSEMAALNLQNSYNNVPETADTESKKDITNFTKDVAPYALGYAGSKVASPLVNAALQHALPKVSSLLGNSMSGENIVGQPKQPTPNISSPQELNANTLNTQTSSQQPPSSLGNANIQQQAQIAQPEVISNPKEYLEKLGVLDRVKSLLKTGNTPEGVAAAIGMKRSGETKIDPELLKNIEEYAKQPQVEQNNLGKQPKTEEITPEKQPIQETEQPKIEKQSIVSTPNGVGEVKEIRNGQAIVEVDGKLHKVKEEELEREPEEVKKSKIEFNLDDVPEDLRSAPLNEVYAPAHRKHVTIKYNSDIGKEKSKRYIFYKKDGSPVDENIIENLRKGSQLPVSNGKTFWGGWSADTQDSRGTVAYHELSALAQKMSEEDNPSKPYWFEEEEEVFTHGYSKQAEKKLKEQEKLFNEQNKKPKKKRA